MNLVPRNSRESSKLFLNISFLVSQVKIAGENIFGTSQPRTVFTFATKGAGEDVQQAYKMTVYKDLIQEKFDAHKTHHLHLLIFFAEPVQQPMVVTSSSSRAESNLTITLTVMTLAWSWYLYRQCWV